jgi:hypothetical protein
VKYQAHKTTDGYSITLENNIFSKLNNDSPSLDDWKEHFGNMNLELISLSRNEEYDFYQIIAIDPVDVTEYYNRPLDFYNLIKNKDLPAEKFMEYVDYCVGMYNSALYDTCLDYEAKILGLTSFINKQKKNVGLFMEGTKP